jgi:hypothetical protein
MAVELHIDTATYAEQNKPGWLYKHTYPTVKTSSFSNSSGTPRFLLQRVWQTAYDGILRVWRVA